MDFLHRRHVAQDFLFGGAFERLHPLRLGDVEHLGVRLSLENGVPHVLVEGQISKTPVRPMYPVWKQWSQPVPRSSSTLFASSGGTPRNSAVAASG